MERLAAPRRRMSARPLAPVEAVAVGRLLFLGASAAAAAAAWHCGAAAAAPSWSAAYAREFDTRDRQFIEQAIGERLEHEALWMDPEANFLKEMREKRRVASKHLVAGASLLGGSILLSVLQCMALYKDIKDRNWLREKGVGTAQGALFSEETRKEINERIQAGKRRTVASHVLALVVGIASLAGIIQFVMTCQRVKDSRKPRLKAIEWLKMRIASREKEAQEREEGEEVGPAEDAYGDAANTATAKSPLKKPPEAHLFPTSDTAESFSYQLPFPE